MANKINNKNNNINKYQKYLYKSNTKTIVTVVVAFVVVLATVGIVALQMVNKNKIETAKTKVKELDNQRTTLSVTVNPEFDDDHDGILNKEEEANGTDYLISDTDSDGVVDGDEINIGIDPAVSDTDGDGLSDGIELLSNLDPKSKLTDGIEDTDREFIVVKSAGEATASLTGSAQMYGTIFEKISLIGFSANSSIISEVYEVYNDEAFKSCKLTFNVAAENIDRDISIYKFNASSGEFEKISSTVDKNALTISSEISQYGAYMVAESATIAEEAQTRVHFLIDNSGSMYPEEMIPNSPENDVNFKRLDFAKELIEKFDDSYSVAVSKFTKGYTYLQEFTSDKKKLYSALDVIKTGDEKFDGTYIQNSLVNCIESFTATDKKTVNIIVLITDGDTTEETAPDTDYIAKLAKEKNIIILTVSIGNNIDKSVLNAIANKTDGKYYSASDANLLGDIHQQIVTALDYSKIELESSSSNGRIGYMLYDTGFNPSENGFGFDDYKTTTSDSMSFGLAVFARDWFTKNLKLSLGELDNANGKADGYDLTGTELETDFENGKNLRDISFIAVTTERFINSVKYLDFEGSKDNILDVEDKINKEALSKGWSKKRYRFDEKILDWDTMYALALDINGKYEAIEKAYGDDEAQFYKAVNRLNHAFADSATYTYNISEAFTTLTSNLSNGIPAVLIVDGNHAVNAISLARNAENPSEYILKVYDPVKKDKVTEILIKKTVGCVVAMDGTVKSQRNFYTASIDGEIVSLSICTMSF